jgi:hypothetical protein
MKSSDYLFGVYPEYSEICIVERSFWVEHGYMDDRHFSGKIDDILPDGFDEVSECTFEFLNGSLEDGIVALLKAGFEQIPEDKL